MPHPPSSRPDGLADRDAILEGMTDDGRFAGWLSCPDCERDLETRTPGVVGCSTGHRFAVNRRGYLGLLPDGWKLPSAAPSTGGTAGPVLDALRAMLPRHGRVLELGPDGLDGLVSSPGAPEIETGVLSTSPRLLERIAGGTDAAAILADPVRRWPVRDGSIAALVAWDGAIAPIESHRVLTRGGALLLVPDSRNADAVVDDLYPWFEHDQTRPIGVTGRTALRLRRRRRMSTW